MEKWKECKNILCIRTDNMGDLLMSIPAIRALKHTFHCPVTLLTSPMAAPVADFIPEIAEVLIFDAPWNRMHTSPEGTMSMIGQLKKRRFDAAVILTVYSQNPLPAALLAFLSGIPRRLAYCRENPYQLLTHWMPEEEPYTKIRHQVRRELNLVEAIGTNPKNDRLSLQLPKEAWQQTQILLTEAGVHLHQPWLLLHTAASEQKRAFPEKDWITVAKSLRDKMGFQLLFTGTLAQRKPIQRLCDQIGQRAYCLAGLLPLQSFIALIAHARLLISVNTATIHIAAATNSPVIVLYAFTNPQHTPWKACSHILFYHPPTHLMSKNQVVQYTYNQYLKGLPTDATPQNIFRVAQSILNKNQ